jgi:hypothetical protein
MEVNVCATPRIGRLLRSSLRFGQMALFLRFLASNLASLQVRFGSFLGSFFSTLPLFSMTS